MDLAQVVGRFKRCKARRLGLHLGAGLRPLISELSPSMVGAEFRPWLGPSPYKV